MKKILITVVVLIVAIIFMVIFYYREKSSMLAISNFTECVQNGHPVMESYPRQCSTPDGRNFTEEINLPEFPVKEVINEDQIKVKVTSPKPDQIISSPLVIEGEARGFWFFEASFPVKLLDANGKEVAVMPVQAQGEWMTEDFVPFKAELKFSNVSTKTGTLVFQKDNPSGLPEHDESISIPVVFEL